MFKDDGKKEELFRQSSPPAGLLKVSLLSSIIFPKVRNSPSFQRSVGRDERLEFQEYVARSYELRNKIAARVGVRQPTHFGFVGRQTRSAGQIIWRSSGSRQASEMQICQQ